MSISVNAIQLVTCDIKKMVSFLTDVFDLEADLNEFGQWQVKLNSIIFNLYEVIGFKPTASISPFVLINVDDEEEIKNYLDKYKFYLYRHSLNDSNELLDPDGRLWGFQLQEHNISLEAHSVAVKHLS